jgi:Restriction endonuclease
MGTAFVVGLALLAGISWIIVALIKTLMALIDGANDAANKFNAQRFAKKKASYSQFVHWKVPDQLKPAEEHLSTTENNFHSFQLVCDTWSLERPKWTSLEFATGIKLIKRKSCTKMDLADLDAILSPNSRSWLDQEAAILSENCRYPGCPPVPNTIPFNSFPELTMTFDSAAFTYDSSKINPRKIQKYFSDEQKQVNSYNAKRLQLTVRLDTLNQQIRDWNSQSKKAWDGYAERSKALLDEELSKFREASAEYDRQCKAKKELFEKLHAGYAGKVKNDLIRRFEYILGNLDLPNSVPRNWEIEFDEDQKILVVEIALPDVVHQPPFKMVKLKSGVVAKPLTQTERKEVIPKVHPALVLRYAYEIFRNDNKSVISLLVVNGWVKFDDPRTGIDTKAYTASLMVERNQIASLNLSKVDPIAAFDALHGKSEGKLVEIVPIEPALNLNKKDSRFVEAKAVLGALGTETNLAAMDWQDFEHLIRELFEKEFSGRGAEVKITQASRDRGVDAVVFDPDPIHGGKYVIQAKRYTQTVDVSSVRDLCAVVKKEGASRGILVTTSTYGADAYAFANNEPVTLLNGAELLGLLKKHGYSFRINLDQARQLSRSHREKAAAE